MIALAIAILHLVSCGGMQISVGPMATIGFNGVGGPQQGQMMRPPNGGGQYDQPQQQQWNPHQMVGKIFNTDCFGGQSTTPTPGCVKILWTDAFGPDCKYWLNDIGKGRAQFQVVPDGEVVFHNPVTKETWRIRCKNRVVVALPPQPRPQPRPQPTFQQEWRQPQPRVICQQPQPRQQITNCWQPPRRPQPVVVCRPVPQCQPVPQCLPGGQRQPQPRMPYPPQRRY